jgi:hypothetical protein
MSGAAMRIISTVMHGIFDYSIGVLLIIAPWLLGFADHAAATWIPVVLGTALILYSFFTDYELGLVRIISMPVHLALDAAVGILLVLSPWAFTFAGHTGVPHMVFGVILVGAALLSKTKPLDTVHGHVSPTHAPGGPNESR